MSRTLLCFLALGLVVAWGPAAAQTPPTRQPTQVPPPQPGPRGVAAPAAASQVSRALLEQCKTAVRSKLHQQGITRVPRIDEPALSYSQDQPILSGAGTAGATPTQLARNFSYLCTLSPAGDKIGQVSVRLEAAGSRPAQPDPQPGPRGVAAPAATFQVPQALLEQCKTAVRSRLHQQGIARVPDIDEPTLSYSQDQPILSGAGLAGATQTQPARKFSYLCTLSPAGDKIGQVSVRLEAAEQPSGTPLRR